MMSGIPLNGFVAHPDKNLLKLIEIEVVLSKYCHIQSLNLSGMVSALLRLKCLNRMSYLLELKCGKPSCNGMLARQ